MEKRFYVTTTLPYVNADPHIGFAREAVQADVLARFHRESSEVFFNTGTDEHGLKIYRRAQEAGLDPQGYVNEQVAKWNELKQLLDLSYDSFIRTTDKHHIKAAQKFWQRCKEKGDIYRKEYKVKYCVGCELEKTDSELDHGKCPLHPEQEVEIIDEENYFFRFSEYKDKLLKLYKNNPSFVVPPKRMNEIKKFIERGAKDFSVSRLKEKMPWGIEVPGDSDHVMYVWFDALVNYISAIGWPDDMNKFNKWWPAMQLAGKDNLRQQSAMWQAMLMSAGIPTSKQIFINGFINVGGQKMSKSLGNVISPREMVDRFGVDGTRYLLLSAGTFGEDVDVTMERMTEKYNADLANGLGNLASRVIKLAQNFQFPRLRRSFGGQAISNFQSISNDSVSELIKKTELGQALDYTWQIIAKDNKYIEETKPWELLNKDKEKFEEVMKTLVGDLHTISEMLTPFMPETSQKIKKILETRKSEALFPRIK